jgi:putative SOS response-associated peptidase YedK
MCGRFNVIDNPMVHFLLEELGIDLGPLPTRYNVAPTEPILTIIGGDQPAIHEMRWWFTPSWSDGPSTKYSMFNAKSETISTSRAFKGAFKYRRGIVPVSSFIEWQTRQGEKQPYLISNEGESLFLAAIWEVWNGELFSCALLTTEASEAFKKLHSRQPVILTKEEAVRWIRADYPSQKDELEFLMRPASLDDFVTAPLDKSVGNSRNKSEPKRLEKWIKISDLDV